MNHKTITIPARRNYSPAVKPSSIAALPFVQLPKSLKGGPGSKWRVPPTDNYERACDIGMEYAAHYVQFLKDNPHWVGVNLLGDIVADMDFNDSTGAKGYRVGFFTYLERLIHTQAKHVNAFTEVDGMSAYYAATAEAGEAV